MYYISINTEPHIVITDSYHRKKGTACNGVGLYQIRSCITHQISMQEKPSMTCINKSSQMLKHVVKLILISHH